jgi:integrase/recombinase XerD
MSRGPVPARSEEPWIPDDDDWLRILRHVLTRECLRNQVLILVCYDGALRRAECIALRVDDIDWAHCTITVRAATTKNGRRRVVALSRTTAQKLEEYVATERTRLVAAYGGDAAGPLFLSESYRNPGQPLTVWTFNDVMEKVRQAVGLPALTPHTLRHLLATDIVRGGLTLDEVGHYLGHASLATTQLYVHRDTATVARRIRAATTWRDAQVQRLIAKGRDDG